MKIEIADISKLIKGLDGVLHEYEDLRATENTDIVEEFYEQLVKIDSDIRNSI